MKKKKQSKQYIPVIHIPLLITPLAFLVILFTLYSLNKDIEQLIQKNKMYKAPLENVRIASYPVLGLRSSPDISAQAAIAIDDDSKVVLYGHDQNTRFSLASTTKIMTALTALEHFKLDDILVVKNTNIMGVTVGFKENEKVTLESLLYAMLLPSGNDAAVAIAQNYPGGQKEFVKKMNENALKLHLPNTVFVDPAGLAEGNYSTPHELALLASHAMQNPIFSQIVGTKEKKISDAYHTTSYDLVNLNRLLGEQGVEGVKTGFTDEAGQVLVTSKKSNGHRYIIIVMKSKDRFMDTQMILSFLEGNISYQEFNTLGKESTAILGVSQK